MVNWMQVKTRVASAGALVCLLCGLCSCVTEDSEYAAYPSLDVSPVAEGLEAPAGVLQEAARNLDKGDAKAVARQLSVMQPQNPLEQAWQRLLLGQAWLELGAYDKAYRLLQANYEELRDQRPAPDPTLMRVLARSLRKLGVYYRDKQDPVGAYAVHQLQWLYMKRVGSLKERFEAAISLDVDAALLRNYFASEQWSREALQTALQMPEGLDKHRSLMITWNNLSATLHELLRFQEADAAARESLRLSLIYDQKQKPSEYRQVLALAQLADVHSAWAQYQETKEPAKAKASYDKARAFAIQAIGLAEKQGLAGEDRLELEQRMRKHCGQNCRPIAPPTQAE